MPSEFKPMRGDAPAGPSGGEGGGAPITEMLNSAANSAGGGSTTDELLPLVYEELRSLAAQYLEEERRGHTLQPTALAHEAYLRLMGSAKGEGGGAAGTGRSRSPALWESRAHFFGAAARAIRRILVDHARARGREKRGGGVMIESLDDVRSPVSQDSAGRLRPTPLPAIDLLALDEALERLASFDPLKARLVEMRFFAGLSVREAAGALGISEGAAGREWQFARLWLCGQLEGGRQEPGKSGGGAGGS